LRVGRLHLNDFFGDLCNFANICLHHHDICDRDDLVLRSLKVARLICLSAEGLYRVHHILGLVNESIAQLHRPRNVRVHFGNLVRELRQFLHVIVPRLVIHFGNIVGIFNKPRGLNNFQRIRGCGQNDRDERVGVKRDWFDKFLQFSSALLGRRRRRRSGICLRCRRICGGSRGRGRRLGPGSRQACQK